MYHAAARNFTSNDPSEHQQTQSTRVLVELSALQILQSKEIKHFQEN